MCEQWGLQAPLGAAELYRGGGSCCGRYIFLTSFMIRGYFPVFQDQQVWARSHTPYGGALRMAVFPDQQFLNLLTVCSLHVDM